MVESYVGKINLDISGVGENSSGSGVNTPCQSYAYMANYWELIDIVSDGF